VTQIDFTQLHEQSATLGEGETTRVVREKAIKVVKDVLDVHPVGVYEREAGRLVTRARSPEFEDLGAETALDVRESRLGEAITDGETTHGPAPDGFGDAESWCLAPTGDGGGIVLLSASSEAFDDDVAAALSGLSRYLESALGDVADPSESFREDDLTRADGVSGRVLLDALRYSFPDYAFLYDTDGTYLDVLLGQRNLALNTREQLVGSTVWEMFDNEADAQTVYDGIQTAIEEWTTQTVEYTVRTPNGDLHYEGQISPLPREEMETDAAVMVARDVTERIEREETLQRQNERLSEFASVVSHDLRNPLEAANGFLQVGRERAEGDTDALDRVQSSLDRIEAIIDDLLTLAREGADVSEMQPVELGTLARSAWTALDTDSTATLTVGSLPTVEADREGLRRVLENLFRNAIEHGGDDVSVEITPIRTDDPAYDVLDAPDDIDGTGGKPAPGEGEFVGFAVADDGPGIDPSEQADVFDTGYTTTRDGTGFGLSIVRRIAQAHGWSVSVQNGADGGACFEFEGVQETDEPTDSAESPE
jgi:PAS domain S-box-containing protein